MIAINYLSKSIVKNTFKFCRFLSTQNPLTNVSDNCNKSDDNVVSFDDFKSLAINKKTEYKIKIILNEYENYRNSDEDRDKIPSRLSITQMRQLLDCNKIKRKGRFWCDISLDHRKHLMCLMKKYEDNEENVNRLITPLMPIEFEKLFDNRLRNAALFGQNIVFDLSFDDYMNTMEAKNLAEQINRIYKFNRYECHKYSSRELPFNLNLCNVNKTGKTYEFLKFLFPELIANKSYINVTSDSYLDVFPKQDIVYLSPHAEQVMIEYDSNAVFIIGGIVDRREVITLSQPKAVQQNIRSVRLPIDSLITKTNIQSLDSVFRLLFDFKAFGVNNENIVFEDRIRRHIPKHKLKTLDQTTYERLKCQELSNDSEIDENFENFDFKS